MMIKRNQNLLTYLELLITNGAHNQQVKRRSFASGQALINQDDFPKHLYLLRSGVAKCFITEENGRNYVLEFLGEGEILGELELLTGSTNLCTVIALTNLDTYQISQDFFTTYLLKEPTFNQLLLQELAVRLSRTARRASYQQIFPIEYAVLKVLYLFTSSDQPVTKQDLADYLAVPLRSLNRVLKYLAEQNLFTTSSNGQLTVHPQKLTELMQTYHE